MSGHIMVLKKIPMHMGSLWREDRNGVDVFGGFDAHPCEFRTHLLLQRDHKALISAA